MQFLAEHGGAHHLLRILVAHHRRRIERACRPSQLLTGKDGLRGIDHLGDRRQRELFQVRRIRHRHVLAGHARDRRVEIVERLVHDARRDFGADARLLPAFLDHDAAAGLLHRGDHRLGVHRPQGAQVDHLGLDVLLGELFGGLERVAHADRPRHDGDVVARAHDLGLADRHARSRRASAPGRTGRRGSRSPGR